MIIKRLIIVIFISEISRTEMYFLFITGDVGFNRKVGVFMEEKEKKLLIQAFGGEAAAWKQLALLLAEEQSAVNLELCHIFLQKAIELEDEESFFLYHQMFSEGSIPLDNASYMGMLADYLQSDDQQARERLKRYLRNIADVSQ